MRRLALAALVACGSTGSDRFSFEAQAGGVEAATRTFTNANGWVVTLTKATLTVGPVYLTERAPLRTTSEGRVVGEVLAQVTVDALSPALVSFAAAGTMTAENVRSAEIWLWPEPGVAPETTNITTVAADLAGEAVRGDERVRFRGRIVLDEAWASTANPGDHSATPISDIRKARGIPASFFPRDGGHLELRVDPRSLFAGADFAALASSPSDVDGTKLLGTDQVARNAVDGLRAATGTYQLRWLNP